MPQRYARKHALGLLAALPLVRCSGGGNTVKVGSKDFPEELFLGELYAQTLEKNGMKVERKLSLGSTQIAMAAMQRGELDLYPEYTGTALLVVLKAAPQYEARAVYAFVKREYEKQYAMTWLAPSPFNDTQAMAATKAFAAKTGIRTLSQLAPAAAQLRLAVIPEFLSRPDGLPRLQTVYGGFRFKNVRQYDIGLKYQAIVQGSADVCVAFSTDSEITQYGLVVFADDKHAFPPYQAAPVVRNEALKANPQIAAALDKLAPLLDDAAIRGANFAIAGPAKREPADVAHEFLQAHGLS